MNSMPSAFCNRTVFEFGHLDAVHLTIHNDATMILFAGSVRPVTSGDAFIACNDDICRGAVQPRFANCNEIWTVCSNLDVKVGAVHVIVEAAYVHEVNGKS